MNRPLRFAAVATALAIALAVLAASSGPVRLWVIAPGGNSDRTIVTEPAEQVDETQPTPPGDESHHEWPAWVGLVLQLLIVPLAVVVVVIAVMSAARVSPPRARRRRRHAPHRSVDALPDVDTLDVDLDAARLALMGGTPGNAVIACWMQLERDAAAAGLPRQAHETSVEYVERVVARASVDPAPIGELAALYREARFSRHPLGDGHREHAREALRRVEAALRRTVTVR